MINDFLCQIPDGNIRLDEYAMNNAICCPLRLSLLDENGNKLGEIECNTNKDFSGYKKCSATDVWLYHKDTWGGLEIMKLQLEFAMNMSGEASEYATAIAKQLDFESDIKKEGVVRVTPTKGVGCVVATQGDYYMISLEVVSKPRLLAIWFGIVAVLWTMWLAARVLSIKFVFHSGGKNAENKIEAKSVSEWFDICRRRGLEDIKFMIPTSVADRSILNL